jgi:hypothetical protein
MPFEQGKRWELVERRNAQGVGYILLEHGVAFQKAIIITFTVIGTSFLQYFHVTIAPVNQ